MKSFVAEKVQDQLWPEAYEARQTQQRYDETIFKFFESPCFWKIVPVPRTSCWRFQNRLDRPRWAKTYSEALDFHEQLPNFGLNATTSSMNALVDCLSRCRQFERAWEQIQAEMDPGRSSCIQSHWIDRKKDLNPAPYSKADRHE